MARWEHLAAVLPRSPNPLSKVSQARRKARKTSWLDTDKQSVLGGKTEKGLLKIERTIQECL